MDRCNIHVDSMVYAPHPIGKPLSKVYAHMNHVKHGDSIQKVSAWLIVPPEKYLVH